MWVTTGYNPSNEQVEAAKQWAIRLQAQLIPRGNRSIQRLMDEHRMDALLVITGEGPRVYFPGDPKPLFFHPGLSVIRIKQLLKGDNDVMVEIAELQEGDSFLDCTLGFAGDGIVASFVVGESGKVVGIESQQLIAELTREGLSSWNESIPSFCQALRRIEVIHQHHLSYLRSLPSDSFDVVYFDPMFRKTVQESSGIAPLRNVANPAPLQHEAITEALRVCKRKVMMKERSGSGEFSRLGFTKMKRASASITYGVIEK